MAVKYVRLTVLKVLIIYKQGLYLTHNLVNSFVKELVDLSMLFI